MEYISKYLEDKRFIQWVYNPNDELEQWWESFSTDYPQEKQNIQLARNILLKLKTKNNELAEEEKILIFSKILKQIEDKSQQKKSSRKIVSLLKYAAVAILFFSVGALLFYQKNDQAFPYYSDVVSGEITGDEAKLIRPDGENIVLDKKNSRIEYDNQGQVVVNDQVLDAYESDKKGTPDYNELLIPFGKTSQIILPDGTKVHLNAGSRLVYPEFFKDKHRTVFLMGEAFFDVKENKNRPFVVKTTDVKLKVLGTKFNVSAYSSDNVIETVLTEGKVSLEPLNGGVFAKSMELLPNQLASFDKGTQELVVNDVDVSNYVLWKDGILKFESTDLSRIVKRLERFYNVRFYYGDPFLGSVTITGKLDLNHGMDETIENFALAASVDIEKLEKNRYEIN